MLKLPLQAMATTRQLTLTHKLRLLTYKLRLLTYKLNLLTYRSSQKHSLMFCLYLFLQSEVESMIENTSPR